jgi:tRNA modification GTPase
MTIYGLSTAPGRAGVAVVRLSGAAARETAAALCGGDVPAPRFAVLRTLRHPKTLEVLDRGLVLWFPKPSSFTGEDVAEFHLHGGRAVLAGVFDALASLGLRLAEPGEFTRRAFVNGKLDLTEAEGLLDLVHADTAAQRRQALGQMGGALRHGYERWRTLLMRAMAYVEASLDFSDEGDIAREAFSQAVPEMMVLRGQLETALSDGRRGEIIREGIQVAIVGAPNVGKSSLLNALAGREAAIVFHEPGTTRDVVEVTLDLDGFPFVLRDTAGVRETANEVELEGIRRAKAAAAEADIVLHVRDATITSAATVSAAEIAEVIAADAPYAIVVVNKIDLHPTVREGEDALFVSAKTGAGLDQVRSRLAAYAGERHGAGEPALITRARHRQEIERAHDAAIRFLQHAESGSETELAAEDLREAADALSRLTGRLDIEDILGQIFSEFCIGK